ncbi:MAG: divergent polysaccharide deacetylase family protein [Alphaproteobacteria bacterium PRO2]|nr:divergent polysaccharide deacetylase family protein [Alphaproteobacteria bacterium PRO2]
MKRFLNFRSGLIFILGLAVILVIADLAMLYSSPRLRKDMDELKVVDSAIFVHSEIADFESAAPPMDKRTPWMDLQVPEPAPEKYTVEQGVLLPEPVLTPEPPASMPEPVQEPEPAPVVEAPKPAPEPEPIIRHEGEPAKIVIIIDDMGMDRKRSQRTVELSGPLTLAFLPYAPKLEDITQEAMAKGHELIIHMPMEPMDSGLNPGSIALRAGMTDADIDAMLEKAFASFSGYKGLNNHMGSRLTKDEKAMRRVMAKLKERGLFFVDSKTIGSSVASRMAAEAGMKYGDRDVFLDHQDTPEFVHAALRQTEKIASKKGFAIAIGHPKDSTINALKEWLPGLKARGFELVPVSAVVHKAKTQAAPVSIPVTAPAAVTSSPPAGVYFGPVLPQAQPPG